MKTPIADRLELLDEDWLAETINDSLDVDWTGRVAARLILERMPQLTHAASIIRELVEALDWIDREYESYMSHVDYRVGAKMRAEKALSRARGEA